MAAISSKLRERSFQSRKLSGVYDVIENRASGAGFPDLHQALRLGVGKRLEQDRVDTVKIAVFAPMPSASERTAVAANPGSLRIPRKA